VSDAFLAAVRSACASGLWSQGVKLVRDGAVSLASREGDEITLRVRERGRAVAPTVILYVSDEEWDCDCQSRVSPCQHVAAATIAFAQGIAPTSDDAAPTEATVGGADVGRLGYRLELRHAALFLNRVIVLGGVDCPLDLSLADRAARRIESPRLEPTHDDMTIDSVLSRKLRGEVPLDHMARAFTALASSPDVKLAGCAVRLSGELIHPMARLEDGKAGGVTSTIEAPSSLEIVAFGVGRVDGVLRPLAETSRFGLRWEKLPLTRTFEPKELGSVAAELVPELERTMLVSIRTKRLPGIGPRIPPRIEFELSHDLGSLHVLPLVVYGDPPRARVDAGKLVLLAPPAPRREEAKERELIDLLRDQLSLVPGRRVRFDGAEAARMAAKLEAFQLRAPSARAHGDASVVPQLGYRMVAGEEGIELAFELTAEEGAPVRHARPEDVARAFREGLGIVALEGGGFARLPAGFLERYGHAILDLIAAREGGKEAKLAAPIAALLASELGLELPERLAKLAETIAGAHEARDAALPSDLRADLRSYQKDGVAWLATLRDAELCGLLADDMGLGKTVQAIAAMKGRVLVVSPRSVLHNWAQELARFRPDLRVQRFDGRERVFGDDVDVTLTTYGLLRNEIDALAAQRFDMVFLDEAQTIKNPDSQVARAAFRLDAAARFCLTGTPIENRLDELWSLMRFAAPGLLGPRDDFSDRYARAIERGDRDAGDRLRRRVRPFVLRRTKKEVLPDLPPRSEAVLYADLPSEERALYDAVRAATKKELVERLAQGAGVLAALEALLRMRQAACHPALLPGRDATSSAKIERLMGSLEELAGEGHRALVFSQWTSFLDLVEPHLRDANIPFLRLDGSTRDREGVVRDFQSSDGPPVLLLSLKAGGTGLNLTAADHVFLLDPWWNPAVEEQAADRAHRIGQDKPVMVYRLVAKDTVEERILALQEKKRALSDAITGPGGPTGGVTREDILELLAD